MALMAFMLFNGIGVRAVIDLGSMFNFGTAANLGCKVNRVCICMVISRL